MAFGRRRCLPGVSRLPDRMVRPYPLDAATRTPEMSNRLYQPHNTSRTTLGARMRLKQLTHGHTVNGRPSPTYRCWSMMMMRCHNSNFPSYIRYGGRGIIVCERWKSFANFLADMGTRPSEKHSIDRWPNRVGNYEPGNCRWATMKEQCRNRVSSRPVVRSDGKLYTSMGDAADDVGGTKNGIFATCVGSQQTHRGFGWRYA